jgi:DNA-binding NtrC family response regulator
MSVLAMVSHDARDDFERKAALHGLDVTVIERASELSALAHGGKIFSVAILPATLPDGIWALWGQLQLMNPRPEILICAFNADFQTWSGVLEAGGHDVLADPFSAEELHTAVVRAEQTFGQRLAGGTAEDGRE